METKQMRLKNQVNPICNGQEKLNKAIKIIN